MPAAKHVLVFVGGTWSAHAPYAFKELDVARRTFETQGWAVRVLMATDPASEEEDGRRILNGVSVEVERVPLAAGRHVVAGAHNQNPTALLCRRGVPAPRLLGSERAPELGRWARRER